MQVLRPNPAWLAAIAAAILVSALTPAGAQKGDVLNPKRCDITQLVLKTCPNITTAGFADKRGHQWSITLAGPIALFEKLETYSQEPEDIYVVDYLQFQKSGQRMLDVKKAWFLYGAEGDPAVCQEPHIYAFRTKADAEKTRKELGGELLQWEAVSKRAKEFAADWSPHGVRPVQ